MRWVAFVWAAGALATCATVAASCIYDWSRPGQDGGAGGTTSASTSTGGGGAGGAGAGGSSPAGGSGGATVAPACDQATGFWCGQLCCVLERQYCWQGRPNDGSLTPVEVDCRPYPQESCDAGIDSACEQCLLDVVPCQDPLCDPEGSDGPTLSCVVAGYR